MPVETQPFDILLDGFHIGDIFLARIGVIKSHMTHPVVFQSDPEVQADGLGVTYMEKTIGLRGKSGDGACMLPRSEIFSYDLPDEVYRFRLDFFCSVHNCMRIEKRYDIRVMRRGTADLSRAVAARLSLCRER